MKGKITGARELITGSSNSGASMKYFLMFLGVAVLFFALSFLFLPVVYLYPYKFALLFTLGSINVIIGLAFYHGPFAYLKVMFSRDKFVFSLMYILSIVFTIWASSMYKSYIFTILAIIC